MVTKKTRSQSLRLDRALSSGIIPCIVLDHRNRILFANDAFARIFRWDLPALEGAVCRRTAADETAEFADLACSSLTPPSNPAEGRVMQSATVIPVPDGSAIRQMATFVPLSHPSDAALSRTLIFLESPAKDEAPRVTASSLHAELMAARLEARRRMHAEQWLAASPESAVVREQATLLGASDCSFLITGPPGSGKRHLCRVIHGIRIPEGGVVVPMPCDLLTSEALMLNLRALGVATGSRSPDSLPGRNRARTVLLLLQDVERLASDAQKEILRRVEPSDSPLRIAATSASREDFDAAAPWMLPEFRSLLRTVTIEIPRLHARPNDVAVLTQHFIEQSAQEHQTSAAAADDAVRRAFREYRWPGEVAELRRTVLAACAGCDGTELQEPHLPFAFRSGMQAQHLPPHSDVNPSDSLDELMNAFEREVISRALNSCAGNKADAARRLGLTRPKLYRRMAALGLNEDEQTGPGT